MIETLAYDPILLIHSSCAGDDESGPSSELEFNTGNYISVFGLLEEPIFCDLLLLPEHTSSNFSDHDYLHLPKNPLNPCGVSNVLTLEKLPNHWISGPVLLSLSSCHIFYRRNVGDDELTVPVPLTVEPIPSTFVLEFSTEQDKGYNANEGQGHNEWHGNSIITVKRMSEIFVDLNVREASIQVAEILRHEDSMKISEVDGTGKSRSEDEPNNKPNDHHPYEDRIDNRDASFLQNEDTERDGEVDGFLHHDHRPRSQYASSGLNIEQSFASDNLKEQALVIAHLNAQLDHGTETIDAILLMSGFFCVFSMMILLWTIYQYYRTTKKSDLFSQEIRESMKTSLDMLQIAVDDLHKYHFRSPKLHYNVNTFEKNEPECKNESTVRASLGKYGSMGGQRIDTTPTTSFKTLSRVEPSEQHNSNTLHHGTSFSSACMEISNQNFYLKGQENYEETTRTTHYAPAKQDNATGNLCLNRNVPISLVAEGEEGRDDNILHPTTPTRIGTGADKFCETISPEDMNIDKCKVEGQNLNETEEDQTELEISYGKATVTVQRPEAPSSLHSEGEKRFSFLGPSSSRQGHSFLETRRKNTIKYNSPHSNRAKVWIDANILQEKSKETEFVLSPSSQPARSLQDNKRLIQSDRRVPLAPLSPCSQLEMKWNEGKTIRRGNLKKRRQYLRPLFQSNAERITISQDLASDDDGAKSLFEPTVLSQVPTTSKPHDRDHQQQHEVPCTIVDPPKLRSIARTNILLNDELLETSLSDQVVKDQKEDAERKRTDLLNTPPLDTVSYKAPRLCFTPASEDDSFIEDYW